MAQIEAPCRQARLRRGDRDPHSITPLLHHSITPSLHDHPERQMTHHGIRHVELVEGNLRLRPPRREEASLYARWWADEEVRFAFCSEGRTADDIAAGFPELEAEARDIGHWIDFVMD